MRQIFRNLLGVGAVATLLLSAQPAVAQQCCPQPDACCDPCADWCDMCGDWEVGAHALYFTPVACTYNYGVNATAPAGTAGTITSAFSKSFATKCSADWGFRVFGRYLSDCSFFGVSYQWFESKDTNSATGQNLKIRGAANAVSVNRIAGQTRLEYQNVDFRFGKYLHRACGCNFYLFGNARWVDLSYGRSATMTTVTGSNSQLNEKSRLEGGALGVGCGADLDIWCNFGLFGDANLLGVIAERSTRNVFFRDAARPAETVTVAGVTYPSDTCINPEVDFRIGINYNWTCGCWTVVGEIGFEVDYFWNAVAFPNLPDTDMATDDSKWFLSCEDVGFSGLFFGAKLLF